MNGTYDYGPIASMAAVVRVRVPASYLGGRWAQEPISSRREAEP